VSDRPAAAFRVVAPLDREAARRRWEPKSRRIVAKRLSAELRRAAAARPELHDLLTAIADEMDEYLGTHAQAIGTDDDKPVWRAALAVARTNRPDEEDQ
jgi:hypothetical protein